MFYIFRTKHQKWRGTVFDWTYMSIDVKEILIYIKIFVSVDTNTNEWWILFTFFFLLITLLIAMTGGDSADTWLNICRHTRLPTVRSDKSRAFMRLWRWVSEWVRVLYYIHCYSLLEFHWPQTSLIFFIDAVRHDILSFSHGSTI